MRRFFCDNALMWLRDYHFDGLRVDAVHAIFDASAMVMMSPFVPLLFQGEEWGASTPFLYFTDHQDPNLGEMVRQGRRREFESHGWDEGEIPDPQALETFARCKLDWSEPLQSPHSDLLDWHRRLIALRQAEPALRDGRMDRIQTRHDEAKHWLVVEREPFVLACNLGHGPRAIHLAAKNHRVLMASGPVEILTNGTVVLPPDSVMVMKL